MSPNDPKAGAPESVGGCYRITAELGHGGMARVYRAVDERSGQALALKQLSAGGERRATMQAMFEREYHTLAQLAHPRIVRVFDYGVDEDRPYYTMELLEGADARETTRHQTLGMPEICLLLRDAASALVLIDSRRLVHRDVSLRNLWCTPDGRAKLIDFGTLAAMGPQTRVAGTPPFVPPEAVYMQALDGRCDLYGLGALAYYLLTKRNAYPAREVGDLRRLWQRSPQPPDVLRPDVPRALSELVMALLSPDPRGRPASAAEVLDRLTAIGELPAEDERHVAQAFLTSPKLIGREEQSALFRKRLVRARRKRGEAGVVAVVARAGFGRSRMLASFVLEAKLTGAAVVSLDATAASSESFALASKLAERLLEVVPLAAAEALDIAGVLGHVSPALHKALGAPALAEITPFERSRRLCSAVVALVEAAAHRQPLVIAVDNVDRADGASLGALGGIAALGSRAVLLALSCDEDALRAAPAVLDALLAPSARVDLPPLRVEETHELLASLFGAVARLDAAASWLHELSQGSPQTCMQYAQYLVDHEIARYEGGQWQLPPDLRELALPASLDAMLEARLAELSPDARALALGLALARDETRSIWQPENHVRIEDYPKLLPPVEAAAGSRESERIRNDARRGFSALDELVRAGIAQQRDDNHVLGQRAMIDALLRVTADDEQDRIHQRLASILEQPIYQGRVLPVRQLQRAGRHMQARAMIVKFADYLGGSGAMNWGAMRVSLSAECGRNALAHFEAEGGSAREGIVLRRLLLLTCSVYDWSMVRAGDAQIAQLRADCGLGYLAEVDPALPPLERLVECLKRAQQAYDERPEAERGLPPADAVRELAGCAMTVLGAYVNSHDVERARAMPAVLEPLRPLSPLIELISELCQLGVDRVLGRELGDRIAMLGVHRLFAQTALPEVLRRGGAAVNTHFQAVEDARRGKARGLQLVEVLVPDTGEDMFLVVHPRWLGHAFRGQSEQAQRFRKRVDLITEDDVWRRKATLFVEAELYALTGDLLSLRRTCDAIAELADAFPGWRPWLCWARAAMHRLRGEYEAADDELRAALALAQPGEHRAWVRIGPLRAELVLLRGDAEGALREAEAVLATVRELGLDVTAAVAAERVRALAESSLLDHPAARASLARMFALAADAGYDGLPLALLHEARARVALAAGAMEECADALAVLRELLASADAPALIHAYEALRAEVRQVAVPQLGAVSSRPRSLYPEFTDISTQVMVRLTALNERQERSRQALQLLLEDSGAEVGHLLLFDDAGLFIAASLDDVDVGSELLAFAQKRIDEELTKTSLDAVTVAIAGVDVATSTRTTLRSGVSLLSAVFLLADADERAAVTGVALLGMRNAGVPRLPRPELVRAISRCLQVVGDSVPLAIDA